MQMAAVLLLCGWTCRFECWVTSCARTSKVYDAVEGKADGGVTSGATTPGVTLKSCLPLIPLAFNPKPSRGIRWIGGCNRLSINPMQYSQMTGLKGIANIMGLMVIGASLLVCLTT